MAKSWAHSLKAADLLLATVAVIMAVSGAVSGGTASQPTSHPTSIAAADAAVSQDVLVAREKRRLEELFIRKLSQELNLPVETEKSFGDAIRGLNRDKARANGDLSEALLAIEKAQEGDRAISKVAVVKAIGQYEKALRVYGQLPIREVARMRKILGPEKLGRYLVAKAEMTEKLKALSVRETSEADSTGGFPPKLASPMPSPKAK